MAPREGQKPFHFLNTSDGKQILISLSHLLDLSWKKGLAIFLWLRVKLLLSRVAGNGTELEVKTIELS